MDEKQHLGSGTSSAESLQGRVRNVLGPDAIRYIAGSDDVVAETAAWAARQGPPLEAALRELRERPGQRRLEEIPFHEELRRRGWITRHAAPRLTEAGELVTETLNRYVGGDRTEETRWFLDQTAAIDSTSRVLDVGCSTGRLLLGLADRRPRRMVGVDPDLFALHLAAIAGGGAARWCCASALALPFPDGAFTHALSFVTLSYLPMRAALRELARVLEDRGRLILTIEGFGYLMRQLRRGGAARRLHLLRELPASAALPRWDWQRHAALSRFAPRVVTSRAGITRILEGAGFEVERCEVLLPELGASRLIGIAARRLPRA